MSKQQLSPEHFPITEQELIMWKLEAGDFPSTYFYFIERYYTEISNIDLYVSIFGWLHQILKESPEHLQFKPVSVFEDDSDSGCLTDTFAVVLVGVELGKISLEERYAIETNKMVKFRHV